MDYLDATYLSSEANREIGRGVRFDVDQSGKVFEVANEPEALPMEVTAGEQESKSLAEFAKSGLDVYAGGLKGLAQAWIGIGGDLERLATGLRDAAMAGPNESAWDAFLMGLGKDSTLLWDTNEAKAILDKYLPYQPMTEAGAAKVPGEDGRYMGEGMGEFFAPGGQLKTGMQVIRGIRKGLQKIPDMRTVPVIPFPEYGEELRAALGISNQVVDAGKINKGGLYETRQDGDFYRVGKTSDAGSRPSDAGGRQGAGVDGVYPGTAVEVRTPERRQFVYGNQERSIDEAVQDRLTPQNNPALRVANEYNQATFNAPYNYDIKIEPSSLRKQSAVGVAYELAAKRTPGYADSVFNAYKADPELGPIIENMGIKSYDELVQASYKQMEKETIDQFRKLPISLSYHQGPGTYLDSKEMLRDVHLHNHMYVYQGGDPHEFLNVVDPETGLNSNEIFRAVHDYFGHAIKGNQFGPKGEEVAWASHAQMYSPLARLAMTAETRGQNSFVNYTPINAELTKKMESVRVRQKELIRAGKRDDAEKLAETLRGLGGQWQYAEQASVLLPPEMTRMDYAGGIPDYLRKLQTPEGLTMEAEHYSRVQGLEQLDPSQYGTGAPGREAERLESAGAQKPRSFFYEAGAQPEPEVVSISKGKYRGKLEGLYDFDADPLGLNKIASVANTNSVMSKINAGVRNESSRMNDLERMIYERGYRGYVSGEKGSRRAVVFEPTQVQEVK